MGKTIIAAVFKYLIHSAVFPCFQAVSGFKRKYNYIKYFPVFKN